MRCLWSFRPKAVDQRSRHKRNDRTRYSANACSKPGPGSQPLQCADPSQPQSRSLPRTPSPRPLRSASETPLSSMSNPSIDRAIPLENPFVTRPTSTSTTRQSSHTTGPYRPLDASARLPYAQSSSDPDPPRYRRTNDTCGPINSLRSHDRRMARSRTRQPGPHRCDDSPTLPANRTLKASFSARMARLPTRPSSTAGTMFEQLSFLDDDSSASSVDDVNHRHDGSVYTSTLTTPAKPNDPKIGSAAKSTIRTALIPAPLIFDRASDMPSAQLHAPNPVLRRDQPLCDQRHCLRHKQTCLEHTPTPSSSMRASRIPQPGTRDKLVRRRARSGESRRFEPDVWIQIARESLPGS